MSDISVVYSQKLVTVGGFVWSQLKSASHTVLMEQIRAVESLAL